MMKAVHSISAALTLEDKCAVRQSKVGYVEKQLAF